MMLFVLMLGALSGCATDKAYRDASLAWDGTVVAPRPAICDDEYAYTDDLIATELHLSGDPAALKRLARRDSTLKSRKKLDREIEQIINPELSGSLPNAACWKTAYENHQGLPPASHRSSLHERHERGAVDGAHLLQAPGYDLFLAEFDDQGERTDVAHNEVPFERSEVALIESRLTSMLQEEVEQGKGGGLNIVLFTHGWHGNASAANEYSMWFKGILEQIAFLEMQTRGEACNRQSRSSSRNAEESARRAAATGLNYRCAAGISATQRRTIGIEVAWRGDSFDIPYLDFLNFWDRKGAAQTAARGAVSDLMARLQKFYLLHSCRGKGAPTNSEKGHCDDVHMLTIGHSFGALMDYHSLSDNLTSGVLADTQGRAYGFGDMTILLNPAFEGERETTLVETSIHHAPFPDLPVAQQSAATQEEGNWPSIAQMPTLVTLQSEGDWATHYAFPAVRLVTGTLEHTTGKHEFVRSIEASGWVKYYYSHRLSSLNGPAKDRCYGEQERLEWYCPFDLEHEPEVVHPLQLCKPSELVTNTACKGSGFTKFPAFAPLWTVQVDKSIMHDHDDIADPAIVRFIALLFRAAYEQEEVISSRRQ